MGGIGFSGNSMGFRGARQAEQAKPGATLDDLAALMGRLVAAYVANPNQQVFKGSLTDPNTTPAGAVSGIISSNGQPVRFILMQAISGNVDFVFGAGRNLTDYADGRVTDSLPSPFIMPWPGIPVEMYVRNPSSGQTSQFAVILLGGSF